VNEKSQSVGGNRISPIQASETPDLTRQAASLLNDQSLSKSDAEILVRELLSVLEYTRNETLVVDAQSLSITLANREARRNLNYPPSDLEKLNLIDLMPQISPDELGALLAPLNTGRRDQLTINTSFLRKNQSMYPVQANIRRITLNSRPSLCIAVVDTSERAQAQADLSDSYEELRSMAERLQTILDDERKRLARELHDDLGQLLAAAKMDVASLSAQSAHLTGNAVELLESLDRVITNAVKASRHAIQGLRPATIENAGLFGALQMMATEFGHRSNIKVTCTFSGELTSVEERLVTPIYRLVQESLNNTAKHAKATETTIELARAGRNLVLRVSDNGIGLPESVLEQATARPTSFGIVGMRERIDALGGHFEITGQPGQGTLVFAQIPMKR